MGNTVDAVGNTVGGTAQYVGGTVTNDNQLKNKGSNTLKNAGKKYKTVGKQISSTAIDTSKAVTNVSKGIGYSAYGGITNDKQMIKKGVHNFKNAGNKLCDAMVGKACILATVTTNVSSPTNIQIVDINTDYQVLQGIIGITLIEPLLFLVKKKLQKKCNKIIEKHILILISQISSELKNITFHQDPSINGFLQTLWQPDNIKCMFVGKDKLCLTLMSSVINSLGISSLLMIIPPQTIRTTFRIKGTMYKVQINMDFSKSLLSLTILDIDKFINNLNSELCVGIWQSVGDPCYNCNTSIDVNQNTLVAEAKVYVKVPLPR